jgi:hypothetical protein
MTYAFFSIEIIFLKLSEICLKECHIPNNCMSILHCREIVLTITLQKLEKYLCLFVCLFVSYTENEVFSMHL